MKKIIAIFQPWGIGDVLMSVPLAKRLAGMGYCIELISCQNTIAKFLVDKEIFQNQTQIRWTKNKLGNLTSLISFIIERGDRYNYILIPEQIHSFVPMLFKRLTKAIVISAEELISFDKNSTRLKNNVKIAEKLEEYENISFHAGDEIYSLIQGVEKKIEGG